MAATITLHLENPVSSSKRHTATIPDETSIGLSVAKFSSSLGAQPKPFKNKSKIATIVGTTTNPRTNKLALVFEGMDSNYFVDADCCYIVKE